MEEDAPFIWRDKLDSNNKLVIDRVLTVRAAKNLTDQAGHAFLTLTRRLHFDGARDLGLKKH